MNDSIHHVLTTADGHRFELLRHVPADPVATLLWLPALGVAARHYQGFAEALAARGIAVFVHEWRGNGSSSLRAGHAQDWGYRELLQYDLPAATAAVRTAFPDLPLHLGGHSLGGQLACCHAGLHPDEVQDCGWLPAARRGGAAFRHRAATCCRWPTVSCRGWPAVAAPSPAAAWDSAAAKRAA